MSVNRRKKVKNNKPQKGKKLWNLKEKSLFFLSLSKGDIASKVHRHVENRVIKAIKYNMKKWVFV